MFKPTLTVLLSLAYAAMVYADCAVTLVSTTKAVTCVKVSATNCLGTETNTPLAATCPFTQNQVIGTGTDSHLHVCNSDADLAIGRTVLIAQGFTCAAIVTVDTCTSASATLCPSASPCPTASPCPSPPAQVCPAVQICGKTVN